MDMPSNQLEPRLFLASDLDAALELNNANAPAVGEIDRATLEFLIEHSLYSFAIGDELLHLRLSLAVAQVPVSAQQRDYLEHLESALRQGPAADRGDILEAPTAGFLQSLQAFPQSDALKLSQGAVLQLQRSWRAWCQQQEGSHGVA